MTIVITVEPHTAGYSGCRPIDSNSKTSYNSSYSNSFNTHCSISCRQPAPTASARPILIPPVSPIPAPTTRPAPSEIEPIPTPAPPSIVDLFQLFQYNLHLRWEYGYIYGYGNERESDRGIDDRDDNRNIVDVMDVDRGYNGIDDREYVVWNNRKYIYGDGDFGGWD